MRAAIIVVVVIVAVYLLGAHAEQVGYVIGYSLSRIMHAVHAR